MFSDPFNRPNRSTQKYQRRGFRLRGNTLVLLFIFFLIGLFLHYGGRTQPVVAFWNDLKSLVGIRSSQPAAEKQNPYKAPEPDVTSDERTGGSEDVASDSRPAGKRSRKRDTRGTSTNQRFAFENEVDFILPAYKPTDQIIRHDGYTLRYREQYEQADWVAYPLLENDMSGDAEREGSQFRPDPMVETGSALPADYSRSGYDRGHLAPAGDFKFSQRLMRESFFMSNMSPQAPQFNRGIWKELEDQVRKWAVRDRGLYVVTGPVLQPGLPTIGKQNEVAVPEYYYKVILYCNNSPSANPPIRMIAFLLPDEGSEQSLQNFVVSVDEVERRTGIDFFPKIPDDLEQKLESSRPNRVIDDWFDD